MSATRDRRLDQLVLVRGVWGVVLLAAPGPVIDSVPGAQAAPATCKVARVLGVRHLVQAAAGVGGSQIARRAWWVDALHFTTMAGVALWAPRGRRLTGTDALIAAAFAAVTRQAAHDEG